MKIRKYKNADREAVEHIHFETGYMGKSMSEFLSNNKLWKNMISYYLDKEPESIFVLEHNKKVVGYLLGCVDDSKDKLNFNTALFIFTNIFRSITLPKKDRVFWRAQFFYLFNVIFGKSKELKLKKPLNAGHLHINLLPEARGKKYGTKLIQAFEKYAKSQGTKIIHAETFQREIYCASNFWSRNKYKEFDRCISLHWKKQLPKEKIYLVCLYKKL